MRDYKTELKKRWEFLRSALKESGATGFVYGNSGGKDSALVGILCKTACENTLGLIMPCGSRRNYLEDKADAELVAAQFGIDRRFVDLSDVRSALVEALVSEGTTLSTAAVANIAPRLRMSALYAVAANENRLVVGTGNRSEGYMGYFTKWGDGACDVNPIADLTVTEIYEFLNYLGAPQSIIKKAPSPGLFDGQTDEAEMGITYPRIDRYLLEGTAEKNDLEIIENMHGKTEHKRALPRVFDPNQ